MSGAGVYLPWSLLVEVLGERDALRLVAVHGGSGVYVPRRPGPTSPITRALGLDAACRLAAHVAGYGTGGIRVELPTGPRSAYKDLRRRVRATAADPALTASEAARRAGVHTRSIHRERARRRRYGGSDPTSDQGDLF